MKQFIFPYIMFENSMEAAKYYEDIFKGEIVYIMHGKDMPECPEDQLEVVMHLQLDINGHQIYMADAKIEDKGRVHLHLNYTNLDEMKNTFNKLAKDGEVIQDLEETFWGAIFGNIIDKYKVTWQFHYSLTET